ncbi:glycosyl hydrolase 108 family protein [Flavobacterium sp. 102]|uniref:glycosyl hydrolase 108 family protein n=1 Tax=Flavobacterium sp. 102 TaxID=2135623 RepID=UPI000EB2B892|nr:glycosyl hydrolase 108 family protein [Flavobacterium sp. 102]RKS00404.1 glycosyl hydrolase family 108 [Flavobacterium sp. 102]RKS03730.1 glycosyl hydrolase family 108 [Flavobacterium sp. 102]
MADFEKAFKRTGIFEGGYTDNPDDNGNWTGGKKGVGDLVGTNYGISAPVYMAYIKRKPTVQDIKNMPHAAVKDIYKKTYWSPIRGNEINDQEVANGIYDMAVNSGVGTAIKLAKRAKRIPENKITSKMDDDFLNLLNQQ